MLCIGRRQGQTIKVDGPCEIVISKASGHVIVGIEAEPDVRILRGEVARKEELDAAQRDAERESQ